MPVMVMLLLSIKIQKPVKRNHLLFEKDKLKRRNKNEIQPVKTQRQMICPCCGKAMIKAVSLPKGFNSDKAPPGLVNIVRELSVNYSSSRL
jgi:hypothetical protein